MGDIVRRGEVFYVRYKDADGVRRMRKSHQPSKAEARRYLLAIEARIARGLVGIPEPAPPPPTVAELAERFLTEYARPRLKDLAAYRNSARKALRRALPALGDLPAEQVPPERFARLRDQLAREFAPASVRITLAFLSTMYGWARKQGLLARNPLHGVERPAPPSSVYFLDREEVNRLLRLAWERAPRSLEARRLATAVELVVRTGLRKGELLGLRWSDLELDGRRLMIARSFAATPKSGKTRHLRLPSACVEPLRQWRRQSPHSASGLVFPGPRGDCYSVHALLALPQLLSDAGCRAPTHPWHALRHTFASHYIMSGGNILTLQKILGHADLKMTLLYAHLAPDYLGDEMDRIKF